MYYSQISYTTLGKHKQNCRLWLEGKRLAACGFDQGQPYVVVLDVDHRTLILRTTKDGDKVVSGRKGDSAGNVHPIIDLCNADVTRHLRTHMGNPARVRVAFKYGEITVSIREIERNARRREKDLLERIREGLLSEGVVCAGGGISAWALAEGLKDQGHSLTCDWILDLEGRYLQSAIRNVPVVTEDSRIFEATVEEIEPSLLSPVDVLSASLPCVGFSRSGISKKHLQFPEADTSGTAFIGLLGIIRATNPSIILHENVPPFATSITCHVMKSFLEKLGYVIQERTLGKELGAFERRDRHIFVAVSRGLAGDIDLSKIEPSQIPPTRLGEVLDEVPSDSTRWKTFTYLADKERRDREAGKGFRRQLLTADSKECGTIGRGYHKARSTEPFVMDPTDPSRSRLLTPREHAAV